MALLAATACSDEQTDPGQVFDVSTADLLEEMSSLDTLARPAAYPFRSLLASSYDRASVTPDAADWFANHDRGNYLRSAGPEYVLMESFGPGVITRIWSPNASGTLRIYLDDDVAPSVEAPMQEWLAATSTPFMKPFVVSAARGQSLYFPIAFQTRARVTATNDDLYYQIDHRLYEEGTTVERFDPAITRNAGLTKSTTVRLDNPRKLHTGRPEWIRLDHGQAGAVTALELTPTRMDEASLRGTVLEMRFDGVLTVRVPLGDFFGTGPGANRSESLAFMVDPTRGALRTRFVMPYGVSAELRLSQASADAMDVGVAARVEDREPSQPSWYFHAGFTGPLTFDAEQPRDLPLIRLRGRGQYVGLVLNVANPDPQWWGEGDEKIYVDGELFPSHFGTGTEDYFGYGWCSTELFTSAWVGQTRANRTDNAGYTSLYRLHMLDRIPFESSFRFDLEALHWATGNRSVPMTYDAVYFWYGDSGALDEAPAPSDEQLVLPTVPAETVQSVDGSSISC